MWDLLGPGLKPVSPVLAGGFLTTVPPGKPFASLMRNKIRMNKEKIATDFLKSILKITVLYQ